jgi:carbamoyl-phosphate synthase large subunit
MGNKLRDITVMVTAAGAPGAPGIIKSLRQNKERRIRIIGTDINPDSAGLYLADKSYIVPPGKAPDFIPRMLEIAASEKIDAIQPLATDELPAFAENAHRFEKIGTKVLVSKPEALEIANNKGKLYRFLEARGIPTPKSFMVTQRPDLEKAVYEIGYPALPVCVKPQVSKGGRGFRILREDINRLETLLNAKPDSTLITLGDMLSILNGNNRFPELVVMEHLPGDEYSVDLLVKDGEPLAIVPRKRDAIKLGVSFVGTIEQNDKVINMATAISRALGLDYNINLQLKYAADGIPKIIEINPRVSGTIVLGTGGGVNMPYLGVKLAMGEAIPKVSPVYNTRMIRYWQEIFIDPQGHHFQL